MSIESISIMNRHGRSSGLNVRSYIETAQKNEFPDSIHSIVDDRGYSLISLFVNPFRANIIDDDGTFHQWFEQYGDELVEKDYGRYANLSIHSECRKAIKLVLKQHEKYWKFAAEKLKEYEGGDEATENKEEDGGSVYVLGLDDWVDLNAATIKTKVKDMSMFLIQIGIMKQDHGVEWINLVHEWSGQRIEHKDDFEAIWKWLAQKLNVELVEADDVDGDAVAAVDADAVVDE